MAVFLSVLDDASGLYMSFPIADLDDRFEGVKRDLRVVMAEGPEGGKKILRFYRKRHRHVA